MSEQRETPPAAAPAPAPAASAIAEPEHTNGIATPPAPAPTPVTLATNNGTVGSVAEVEKTTAPELELEVEEAPVIRMRNTANMNANTNGQQASLNGHAAVQRGLEVLAETESVQTNEEIKKLDTQLDHFNKYLDKFEKKNSELTERLSTMLKQQKEERVKRRASFMQREEELKVEQDTFENQLKNMFAKCAQMRRTSAPVIETGVDNMLEQSRRIREGSNEAPIHEANGHEEAEPTPAK